MKVNKKVLACLTSGMLLLGAATGLGAYQARAAQAAAPAGQPATVASQPGSQTQQDVQEPAYTSSIQVPDNGNDSRDEELLARIRAHLRRAGTFRREGNKLIIGDLVICRDTRQVTRGGQFISLTRREFDLLSYLAENAGLVLSRETILDRVWGFDYYGNTNVVDVYIRYLRAKIDEPFPTRLLHTVRGVGYTLREEK